MSYRNGLLSPWTAASEARLRELVGSGTTLLRCSEILTEEFSMPFSKNSCVGKNRRMSRSPMQQWVQATMAARRERAARRKPPRAPTPPRKHAGTGKVRLENLENNDCRWPCGDRPPFLYCGNARKEGSPYCAEHSKMAGR